MYKERARKYEIVSLIRRRWPKCGVLKRINIQEIVCEHSNKYLGSISGREFLD